jgi:hypothetical protein
MLEIYITIVFIAYIFSIAFSTYEHIKYEKLGEGNYDETKWHYSFLIYMPFSILWPIYFSILIGIAIGARYFKYKNKGGLNE